jgi:hypothetical protein
MKSNATAKSRHARPNSLLPSLKPDISPTLEGEQGPPKFTLLKDNQLAQEEADIGKFIKQVKETVRSADPDFFTVLITQVSNINTDAHDNQVKAANFSAAFMHGLKAKDQTEAILIAQMTGTHNLIMEFMRRAIFKDQYLDAGEKYTYRACKLMNLFLRQIETLEKYRGKLTQQKVIVEHVHVEEGGKAIVGNIENRAGGGRDGQ